MLKVLMVLSSLLVAVNADASAFSDAKSANIVFDCKAEMSVDVAKTMTVGITVEERSGDYVATLTGATMTGPLAASKESLSLKDSLRVGGVRDVLLAVNLSAADRAKIASVVIYTQGNLDDDGAGVRGIQFVDAQGTVVASGMLFAWAGPVVCQ